MAHDKRAREAWEGLQPGVLAFTRHSPVTNPSYNMASVTDGVTVDCTGGKKSYVTLPIQAAQNY